MKRFSLYTLVLSSLLATACSDVQEVAGPAPDDGTQLTVKFVGDAMGGRATRSSLVSDDPMHHVTSARILVFDGTGGEAPCVADETIDRWDALATRGDTAIYTLKTYIPPRTDIEEEQPYTVMAVGLDDVSALAYQFDHPATLAEAQLVLNTTAGAEQAQDNMAHAEFFTGQTEAPLGARLHNEAVVEMRRRVAGVMAYFNHIPKEVTCIDVVLHEDLSQHTTMPLAATNTYATGVLDNSRVLLRFEGWTDDDLKAESVTLDDGTTYTKEPGSLLMGAYVLPLDAPPTPPEGEKEKPTLQIIMYKDREKGEEYGRRNVLMPDRTMRYPLKANAYYSIGRKNKDTDKPEDLDGKPGDSWLYVDGDWQANVDIDFDN